MSDDQEIFGYTNWYGKDALFCYGHCLTCNQTRFWVSDGKQIVRAICRCNGDSCDFGNVNIIANGKNIRVIIDREWESMNVDLTDIVYGVGTSFSHSN